MAKKEKKEKTVSEIAKELTLDKRNGYCKISDAEMKKVSKFCENYKKYMDESKTERECVDYAVNAAEKAGFVPFERGKDYKAGDKVYYSNRNKSLCLAVIGKNGLKNGTRIVAAHIDSPRLDLKPIPVYEASEQALLKTHYYGGIKKYQWLAIPLSMHGKVLRKDGKQVTINVGEKEGEPQFCITDILPHLGKDQAVKKLGEAVAGEDLNILAGSLPVSREKGESLFKLNVLKVLNDKYGIIEDDFISAEIEFVPAFKASDVGIDQSMIGAYGQDDRVCAYTAMEAILDCGVPDDTAVVVLADKE